MATQATPGAVRTPEQVLSTYSSRIFFLHHQEREASIKALFTLLRCASNPNGSLEPEEVEAISWGLYLVESLVEDDKDFAGKDFEELINAA